MFYLPLFRGESCNLQWMGGGHKSFLKRKAVASRHPHRVRWFCLLWWHWGGHKCPQSEALHTAPPSQKENGQNMVFLANFWIRPLPLQCILPSRCPPQKKKSGTDTACLCKKLRASPKSIPVYVPYFCLHFVWLMTKLLYFITFSSSYTLSVSLSRAYLSF